ncbi:MAG: dimethylargininase [Proteobacteria bacterium]|nr:dimethylargininase [Pseudomonadota bacterium]
MRTVAESLGDCELSFLGRSPIDVPRARAQQAAYARALGALGCHIEWLPPLSSHPDGVFVEDTAVVVDEVAVITRPGAASRRGEVESTAVVLAGHRPVVRIRGPATIEGGDVLRVGRQFYVGASARSNAAGVAQLGAALAPHGYSVQAVAMRDCLHLKSAATFIAPGTLLANPAWVDPAVFGCERVIEVAPEEPFGANTLTLGGVSLVSADYPATRRRLEQAGIATQVLEVGELHKAEAALTCLSIILGA